jgi:predicted MPP superfamily phosphohydrolase
MFLFILILCGCLYVADYFVASTLVQIFGLEVGFFGAILQGFVHAGTGSFIIATVLGMYYYDSFTRWYYTLSAVYMGLFFYVLLACVGYVIACAFFGVLASYTLGIVFLVCACITALYGVFNARYIEIKHINMHLPVLPDIWKGKKIVWISDLHVGQLLGSDFVQKIVQKIHTLSPDIIFIGGDLYDGTKAPDVKKIIQPLSQLSAPLGTYFITGNHEEFGDNGVFLDAVRGVGITTLIDEMIEIDGLQIIGVDYVHSSHREDFRNILSSFSIDTQKPSLLLKHEPRDLDIGHSAGISLQISGHTHQAQLWPLGYIADWMYKGCAYGLHKVGNMQVYTSSGVGTWGPPLRVGSDSEIVVFTCIGEKSN